MTINEEARHRMHGRLEVVRGAAEAATLMEHLPPVGWADVATRRDLEPLATKAEMAELRLNMADLGASLRLEMAELGASLRLEIADLRAEIRGGGRSLLLSLVGLQLSAAGLVVAVSKLV